MSETEATLSYETIAEMASDESSLFQNSWLVDIGGRIRQFRHNDTGYITKDSRPSKAAQEQFNAQEARRLLAGTRIGSRALEIIVPRVIQPKVKSSNAFLVSPYIGPDLNEQYYHNADIGLDVEDFRKLYQLISLHGISYPGFLPRNMIVSDKSISLIDWESAHFHNTSISPNRLDRTSSRISWSYFYGDKEIAEIQSALPLDDKLEPDSIAYELAVAELIGYPVNNISLRDIACRLAIAAEAGRLDEKYTYKPDDAFHVISEVLPTEIEVLIDIMLATLSDYDHSAFSQLLGLMIIDLRKMGVQGYPDSSITAFKNRCVKLTYLLMDTSALSAYSNASNQLEVLDNIAIETDNKEITARLRDTVTSVFPGAKSTDQVLKKIAHFLVAPTLA